MASENHRGSARTVPITVRLPGPYARLLRGLSKRTGRSQAKVFAQALNLSAKEIGRGHAINLKVCPALED